MDTASGIMVGVLFVIVGSWSMTMIIRDVIRSWKDLRRIYRKIQELRAEDSRLRLEIIRLARRKQDWTPREDPALWRNE